MMAVSVSYFQVLFLFFSSLTNLHPPQGQHRLQNYLILLPFN